jgi:hypothetical protein
VRREAQRRRPSRCIRHAGGEKLPGPRGHRACSTKRRPSLKIGARRC